MAETLAQIMVPAAFAVAVWWFGTGLVLLAVGLPPRARPWVLLGATAALGAALATLAISSADASATGAYVAFAATVAAWGWAETCFLLGALTGPRPLACPEGCTGWRRAGHALNAILYHELSLLAAGAAVVAATWGAANQVGAWTFAVLWTMRLSAKLNLFLGVPVLNDEFLPAQLGFLRSYFARRPVSLLFPLSITVPTAVAALLAQAALAPGAGAQSTGLLLVAALLALAVVEHWFMLLPLPLTSLWGWSMRSRAEPATAGGRPAGAARGARAAPLSPVTVPAAIMTHRRHP
ncbi:MAG: DUF3623 domain-containing protein [Alphaproteobacteria bacterium]|nr:DUF3623 domain-containing protein [Alphaproteobacteria bacterium]